MLYELRNGKTLVARGSQSYCMTRLFQATGRAVLDESWTLTEYFDVKTVQPAG